MNKNIKKSSPRIIPRIIARIIPWILALFSGAIWFLSCPPYPFWYIGWIAMVPLFFALENVSGKKAFYLGWSAGFVAMMGGFPWITDLIVTFAKLPYIVALPITMVYNLYQALIFALFAWLFKWTGDNTRLPVWLRGALIIALVEYLFPLIFPWYFAITQGFVPSVIQISEFTGPIGVSAILLISNGFFYSLLKYGISRKKPPVRLFIPLAILILLIGWSIFRKNQIKNEYKKSFKMGIAMVQPNIGIPKTHQRWLPVKQVMVHQKMSQEAERLYKEGKIPSLDLIIWSESSYAFHIDRNQTHDFIDPPGKVDFRKVKRGFTTPLLMGAGTTKLKERRGFRKVYNSAILWDRNGEITGKYDKNWLLMFGEYIPFYDFLPFLHDFFRSHRMSNGARGHGINNLVLKNVEHRDGTKSDVKIGPLICYEDILPSFGRMAAKNRPNILVNITNDAWFGATQEPWEHLALAVFRSVETRLPLARTVNTGVTAFVMPDGQLATKTPSANAPDDPSPRLGYGGFKKIMENAKVEKVREGVWRLNTWPHSWLVYSLVPVMKRNRTFYTIFGDLFSWLCIIALLIIVIKEKKITPSKVKIYIISKFQKRKIEDTTKTHEKKKRRATQKKRGGKKGKLK